MTSVTDDRLNELKEMYDKEVKAIWGLDDLARDGSKLIELACEGREDWVKQWFMRTWGLIEKDIECMQEVLREGSRDIDRELEGKVRL